MDHLVLHVRHIIITVYSVVSISACIKVSHLILRKIIKFVATRCQVLRLKCTKFNFGWGSTGGTYSASSDPLAGFKGAYF